MRNISGIAATALALTVAVSPMEAQQQAPVRVPTAVLERYVGEYDQNGSTIRIRLQGDRLVREVPGQQVALVPISETLFQLGPVFTVEFVTDQAGAVTQVLSDGVEIEHRLPRRASGAAAPPAPPTASPAPAAAAVRVPRSVLERYVGEYEFVPGQMRRTDLRIVVRLKGDTLTRWMGGGQDKVLTPVSETRFRVGSTSLMMEFVIDEAGVTQVLGTGRQQMLARLTSRR